MGPLGGLEVASRPGGVDRAYELQVLRHRLPPFLGEAFGGSTAFVDVCIRRDPRDLLVCPHEHVPVKVAQSNVNRAAAWMSVLADRGEHNPAPEVANLLQRREEPTMRTLADSIPVELDTLIDYAAALSGEGGGA